MAKQTVNNQKVREMKLWINNTSELYFNHIIPLLENYTRKYVKGNFDKKKAIKGFELVIPYGIQNYNKSLHERFSLNKDEKQALAKELYDYYEDIMKEMFKKAKKLKK